MWVGVLLPVATKTPKDESKPGADTSRTGGRLHHDASCVLGAMAPPH